MSKAINVSYTDPKLPGFTFWYDIDDTEPSAETKYTWYKHYSNEPFAEVIDESDVPDVVLQQRITDLHQWYTDILIRKEYTDDE